MHVTKVEALRIRNCWISWSKMSEEPLVLARLDEHQPPDMKKVSNRPHYIYSDQTYL